MSGVQGLRWQFAEERAVLASQAAQVPDAALGSDAGDRVAIWVRAAQRRADAVQLAQPKRADWPDAEGFVNMPSRFAPS